MPHRISTLGILKVVLELQLLYVSKQTFKPSIPEGKPNPSPLTNPEGGAERKLNASPSAPVPPNILKSNSALHLLHIDRLMG